MWKAKPCQHGGYYIYDARGEFRGHAANADAARTFPPQLTVDTGKRAAPVMETAPDGRRRFGLKPPNAGTCFGVEGPGAGSVGNGEFVNFRTGVIYTYGGHVPIEIMEN